MPIHEYRCSNCGSVNEFLVGIGRNSDAVTCKSCGGDKLEKLMSAATVNVNNSSNAGPFAGSTCCGGAPSDKGCVPGSCCGSA